MRSFSFYHKDTGMLNGSVFSTDDDSMLSANIPADHKVIEGALDRLSQSVDIATGQVIDYQPPQPSADFEWNATTKRWQLSAAVAAKRQASTAALAAIESLESKGIRAMRELTLGMPGAQDRVAAIDAQISALRQQI
jgi:hypothetical protein